jgi:uncharacterized protein (DUF58 family)
MPELSVFEPVLYLHMSKLAISDLLEQVQQTPRLELLAKQLVEGFITGLHKSPYHGFSVEFAEHRLYNPGESTRHIDWKVFARTDRLYTKRYEEETNLRCQLVIDHSGSMHYPQPGAKKLSFAILCAASMAWLLHRQRDAVGLALFGEELSYLSEVRSTLTHLHSLLQQMQQAASEPASSKRTRTAEVLHTLAGKLHKRSLLVLFSDMFAEDESDEEIFGALQHLRHNKHELIVFHVSDSQTERQLQFEDRPHRFVDLETGERLKLNPAEVRDAFELASEERYRQLKLRCLQLRIDFVEADIRQDFEKVLLTFLLKRHRMR